MRQIPLNTIIDFEDAPPAFGGHLFLVESGVVDTLYDSRRGENWEPSHCPKRQKQSDLRRNAVKALKALA